MKRFIILGGFLLGATFLAPMAVADDHHQDRRYYDRGGKDYHVYNSQEDKAYRVYLGERHENYREFNRINRNQQQQYFTWRHTHPDNVIFKVEVR